jgi:hypothetical protein
VQNVNAAIKHHKFRHRWHHHHLARQSLPAQSPVKQSLPSSFTLAALRYLVLLLPLAAGWNVDPVTGEKLPEVCTEEQDLSLVTAYQSLKKRKAARTNVPAGPAEDGFAGTAAKNGTAAAAAAGPVPGDDSARGGVPGGGMV